MRAQIIKAFGDPDVFELSTLPDPVPESGQVLLRVAAASVNPVDTKLRRYGPPIAPALPAVLGCDVAGTVIALGDGVDDLAIGDRVFGCVGGVRGLGGTYAEQVTADVGLLARSPRSMPLADAAALPLVTITAWEGLFDRARMTAGQTLLVHGGAGGVGHIVVQLAHAHGVRVFATVSSEQKATVARELGAEETINYRQEPVDAYVARLTGGRGFDVVFDATGGSDLATSFAAVRTSGQVVTIVSQYQADLTPMHLKGLTLHVVFMLLPMLTGAGRARHREILTEAARLVDARRLRPIIDPTRFNLETVADAHRHLESGQAIGKILVDVS